MGWDGMGVAHTIRQRMDICKSNPSATHAGMYQIRFSNYRIGVKMTGCNIYSYPFRSRLTELLVVIFFN
jgi:hypothetical protein